MNLFLNSASTPPAVQLKANGSPLASMRLKRGAVVPLSVTVLGVTNATNLRFGIKSAHEGEMLALAAADSGTAADNGTTFTLSLEVRSNALDAALHVGDAASSLSKLVCMAEFAWTEGGEQRLSDTITTTILNDIVRLSSESPEALSGVYPAPDTLATKAWVQELKASAEAAGLVLLESDAVLEGEHTAVALTSAGTIAIPRATGSKAGTVILGTNDTLSGLHVLPIGKDAQGRLAVDASGLSAYDLAVKSGFLGTQADWLASLKGEPGEDGQAASAAELEALLTDQSEVDTRTTPSGTDNALFLSFELGADYVPVGKLRSVELRCGNSSSGMTTEPFYLGIWEKTADNTGWEFAGISSNAATQAGNATLRWDFPDGVELHGRLIFVGGKFDRENIGGRGSDVSFYTRVSPSDGYSRVFSSSRAYNSLPEMSLAAAQPRPRFAPASHVDDATCHTSATQQRILSAFEWDTTFGLSIVHCTDGAVDGRLRFVMSAGSTTCMTSGTLTFQTPHFATVGRTAYAAYADTSGTSYCFSGHTLSTSEMEAYGITEPCVWAGDPLLPLLLRGSSIRINGQAIDPAALLELLAHKDEILAALSTPSAQSDEPADESGNAPEPPAENLSTPDPMNSQN